MSKLPNVHLGQLKFHGVLEKSGRGPYAYDGHPWAVSGHVIASRASAQRPWDVLWTAASSSEIPPPHLRILHTSEFWEPRLSPEQRLKDVSDTFEKEGGRVAIEATQRGVELKSERRKRQKERR